MLGEYDEAKKLNSITSNPTRVANASSVCD